MKDLTVIVPIHEYNEEIEKFLTKAIDSFKKADDGETELLFVGPKNVLDVLKTNSQYDKATFVENSKKDFCSQINVAVTKCRKYFSILEFDDVYTPNWFKNVEQYMTLDDNVSVFLPLTEILMMDKIEEGPIGYVNEAVWATSFSEELGYLDIESLMSYMNFNTTGGVFKTEDFIDVGKLKESMKLTYWYEFLLRTIYNGRKVYVIPKVGYQHLLNREGSISDRYNKELKPEEADFWIETAQKEYLFKNDRNKKYEE